MRQLNALSGGDLSGSSYTGQKTSGQKITADMLDGVCHSRWLSRFSTVDVTL